MNTSINKYIIDTTEEQEDVILSENSEEEESGWTTYFQDYSLANNYHKEENFISSITSSSCSSLISDAAWNGTSFNANINNPVLNRLNFKNIHNTYTRCQDDLEDTASSPVNSPKIGINRRKDDVAFAGFDRGSNEEKGSSEKYSYLRRNEKKKNGENVIDIKDEELKKRGMCVMPMSTFINYIK